ncbi:hypothetical protein C8R43DRAFT_941378 [Mycena crocata]|nr:hypothetical protein C8R43DRAFT_941378 [Mycena crocata]
MRISAPLISVFALLGSAFSWPARSRSVPQLVTCIPSVGPVSALRQRVIFENFVDLMYKNAGVDTHRRGRNSAQPRYPAVLDGAAASFAIVNTIFTDPTHKIQIIDQAFEVPVGWVHIRIDGLNAGPTAIVDMYRFNGSCIVEHWDVIQERPVNATNSHPLF